MFILYFLFSCCCLGGTNSYFVEYGKASYYGEDFHGKKTASGEVFNMWDYTCAHKTLPFNTKLKVTNLKNKKTVIVRVNDRGPFVRGRIIDLSFAAAKKIGMIKDGIIKVKIERTR
jgi:rare lipoprotein A